MSAATEQKTLAAEPKPARRNPWEIVGRIVVVAVLAGIVWWAYKGIDFDFTHLKSGLKAAGDLIHQMFPHSRDDKEADIASLKSAWQPLIETLQMAIVGTLIGAVVAFPISFFAARTTTLFRPLSYLIKGFLNIGRAIPVLVYALFIVSCVGLGAPPGTMALAFGAFVMLAKLYAEGLESVTPGPLEAVRASGGNAIQTFIFGMLPQVFPNYLSATLYAFELNIAASGILGFVGAGGIGFMLQNDLRLFNMLETGVLLAMLIVLINIVDYASYRLRLLFT